MINRLMIDNINMMYKEKDDIYNIPKYLAFAPESRNISTPTAYGSYILK